MRRLIVLILLLVVLTAPVGVGLLAAPAWASTSPVVSDCNANGHLTGNYSRGALQSALNGLGADTREYTNCSDVIRRALLASASSGGQHPGGGSSPSNSSGGGGGAQSTHGAGSSHNPGVSTRGVYSAPAGATAAGPGSNATVNLPGGSVSPGNGTANTAASIRSLPAPLIALLALLALVALSGGGIAIRRRVITRHST